MLSDPEQSSDFSKGDILITMSTNPGWTPLFIMAGGIVTEIGGALSHGAIIAREYGIPMVTAVPGITKKLNTGDLISLDGSSGIIKKIYNMKND